MRIAMPILCCVFLTSCAKSPQPPREEQKSTPPRAAAREPAPQVTPKPPAEPEKQIVLPDHKFSASSRPGRGKSQVRAVVNPGSLTKAEFMQTAVDLCKKHASRGAGSFLVQFFSNPSSLEGWDGTGLLRDSDWPHWLCRITVETDTNGRLYARTFKLAVDMETGQERADVLKDE